MLMIVTMVAGRMGMMEKNGSWAAEAAAGKAQKKNQPVVVIDSGHGGRLYRRKCGKCRWGPDSDSGGDSYSGNSWNTLLENSVSGSI